MKAVLPRARKKIPKQARNRLHQNKERITVGEYLIKRLKETGAKDLFASESASLKNLLEISKNFPGLHHIAPSSSPVSFLLASGAAFVQTVSVCAVDSYTTASLIHLVEQANDMSLPLVVIVGSEKEKQKTTEEDDDPLYKFFKKMFVNYTLLDDPIHAAKKIDRALDTCIHFSKPICLELPQDIVYSFIPPHQARKTTFPPSDLEALRDVTLSTKKMLHAAENPVVIVGREMSASDIQQSFFSFVEKFHLPWASTLSSKSVLNEDHPLFYQTVAFKGSFTKLPSLVQNADLLLCFGIDTKCKKELKHLFKDTSIAFFTQEGVEIDSEEYSHVFLHDLMLQLAYLPESTLKHHKNEKVPHRKNNFRAVFDEPITFERMALCLQKIIGEEYSLAIHRHFKAPFLKLPFPQNHFLSSPEKDTCILLAQGATSTYVYKRMIALTSYEDAVLQISQLALVKNLETFPIIIVVRNEEDPSYNLKALEKVFGFIKHISLTTEDAFEDIFKKASSMSKKTLLLIEAIGTDFPKNH